VSVHSVIRQALREVMLNQSLPIEARKQAEELLASLHDLIDSEKTRKPCSDRLAIAERENAMDRLWKLFEHEQFRRLEAIHTHGIDWDSDSHRLTAETAIALALAELKHRENIRLVEELESKLGEMG